MAKERLSRQGELVAFQVAFIAGMFGGKIDPAAINPYGERPTVTPEMQRIQEWQAKRRWKVLAKSKGQSRGKLENAS